MPKRFLLDTNIILDIALKRSPFFADAKEVLSKIDEIEGKACVTATTITDIWYIASKQLDTIIARNFILDLVEVTTVLAVQESTIIQALSLDLQDFEDAVQLIVAQENRIEAIITRNKKDFRNDKIAIFLPQEFIKL